MDLYTFGLALGFIGLLLMSVLGALGGHGSSHSSHGGHDLHGADAHGFHLHGGHSGSHGAGHSAGHVGHHETALPTHGAHGAATHHHGDAPAASHQGANSHAHAPAQSSGAKVLSYLSPRVLFAVSLGFGATGLLLAPYLAEPLRAVGAVAGGIGLEKLVISPLWNGLMRFGSNPARTLESAVLEEAVAVTAFDQDGLGLVSIDLDGHEMRVLARLQGDSSGPRIRAGDKLIVEEVDAARGQCRVSRLRIS